MIKESSLTVSLCEENAWLPPLNVTTVTCTQTALWGGQLIIAHLQCASLECRAASESLWIHVCIHL